MSRGFALVVARFDRLSLRERILTAGATLAALVMAWIVAFLDPATTKEQALGAEIASLESVISATTRSAHGGPHTDPTTLALRREAQLQEELARLDAQLAAESAGLIPPQRTVEVIHDVLSRQRGVKLISLHNEPVTTLVPPAAPVDAAAASAATPQSAGPYVHPVELVIEGRYLDVVAYLRALESLEWRFY